MLLWLRLLGGLALLLGGIGLLGSSLQSLRNDTLPHNLTRWQGALLGAGATAILQSSSAVTVSLCAMTEGGLLSLSQAAGLIYGSNLGTTSTAWLCAIGLRPGSWLPMAVALAALLPRKQPLRHALLGLAILLVGLEWMSSAAAPLAEPFTPALEACSSPLLGFLLGAGMAAVLQTSSGAIALIQAIPMLPGHTALAMTLGCNVGTCATALLASAGCGYAARQTALLHLLFNLMGIAPGALLIAVWPTQVNAWDIALFHTVLNGTTLLFAMPCSPMLEGAATRCAAFFHWRRPSTDFSAPAQ